MLAHPGHQLLPELFAAFRVDAFVPDDGELLHPRRNHDQDRVPLRRLLHPELDKFLLRADESVFLKSAPLEEHADLATGLRFRLLDGLDNPIVLELTDEIMRAHAFSPTAARPAATKAPAAAAKSAEPATR